VRNGEVDKAIIVAHSPLEAADKALEAAKVGRTP